jgi:PAS domain S-box-containing protein
VLEEAIQLPAPARKTNLTGTRPTLTPTIAVFLVGLAISAALFAIVMRHSQQEELHQAYQEEAAPLALVLGRSLENTLEALASIRGLYAASNEVERDEFRAFVERTVGQNGEVQAIEWIPRVSAEDRAAYEAAARADGLVDFRITEKTAAGETVPAAARREYFPAYFVEPFEGNETALGLDLAADPVRLEALNRARDTGKIVTTQRFRLAQVTGEQFGFLAFVPIYSTGSVPETIEARREKLTGFALGVFRIGDILHSAMARTRAFSSLDLYVIDAAAPAGAALLYHRETLEQDGGPLSYEELLLGGYEKTTLSVADRNWLLVFVPAAGFRFPASTAPWIVGTFGILATILFIAFQRATQNRTRLVEQTVYERTAELSAVNRALEDEMAERQHAEQLLKEQNETLELIYTLTVDVDKATTIDDAIRICLDEVCSYTGWPVGHAFRPAEEDSELFVTAGAWHLAAPDGLEEFVRVTEATKIAPGQGVIGQVLEDREPRWITNINQDNGYIRTAKNRAWPVKSAFFFPFLAGQTVIAVLEFYALEEIELDERTLAVITQIRNQLGRAAERVQAAAKLHEREEFVRLITDNMPVVIAYFDAEMNTRFYNQVGLDWFACTREDVIGKPIDGMIPELDVEKYRSCIRKVLDGETQTFDATHTYPDGKIRHVTVSYIPHVDESGDAIGYFCIVQDITQRVEIERQLNQAQKMDAIGQLTGGIAHDFNNILMVTDGYTRRALKNIDDPAAVTEALEEVLKGTDRAARLTKQLLSFSRRQIMEKRVFRIEEAITEIEGLLQKSTGERYELHIESDTNGACVETDESEFNQALINLVINARDAMPTGGRIEVSSQVVELDEDFAAKHQKLSAGRFVEVSVKDYGVGIDDDTLEHIFEPFFTTKDQGKGTGLGLAMVYGFAQSSGGAVEVETAVEAGATFKIYLPAVDRDPQKLVAEVEEEHLGQGETILLIEDDPPLLELARGTLESLGYNVLTASDGFEAIEIEAEHEAGIDLLLSDVVMPTIGGFEVASMIRESRPDIKIVFMSGYPNRAGISNENVPDNCQFLQKPVKPAHLAQALRHELDREGPDSQPENRTTEKTHDYAR